MTLARSAFSGFFWLGIAQGLRLPLQLALTAILARILLPEDFGLFAMIVVLVDLLSVTVGLGIGPAIVSRQELTDGQLATLFWLQVGLGLLLAGAVILAGPLAVLLYDEPRLAPLTSWLAIGVVLAPLGAVPMGLLERRLQFARVAVVETVAVLLAGALSVWMALRGWGAVSLVALWVAGVGFQAACALIAARWMPRFEFRPLGLGAVVRFGTDLTGNRLLHQVARSLDSVIVGRYLGATALGYYGLGYRITSYPLQAVLGVLGRVMFPVLASMQPDDNRVRDVYVRSVGCMVTVAFPALALGFVTAPGLVGLVLGDRWAPVVPLARVFCVAGLWRSVVATMEPLYLALRRPDLLLRLSAGELPIVAIGLGAGVRWGIQGVAIGAAAASAVVLAAFLGVAVRVLRVDARRAASGLGWGLGGGLVAGVASAAWQHLLGSGAATIWGLASVWTVGLSACLAILWVARSPGLVDLVWAWREALRAGWARLP